MGYRWDRGEGSGAYGMRGKAGGWTVTGQQANINGACAAGPCLGQAWQGNEPASERSAVATPSLPCPQPAAAPPTRHPPCGATGRCPRWGPRSARGPRYCAGTCGGTRPCAGCGLQCRLGWASRRRLARTPGQHGQRRIFHARTMLLDKRRRRVARVDVLVLDLAVLEGELGRAGGRAEAAHAGACTSSRRVGGTQPHRHQKWCTLFRAGRHPWRCDCAAVTG